MCPWDVPALEAALAAQNERDGTSYGLPEIFEEEGTLRPTIALALVAVDVETGEVVQGHLFERTLELSTYGMAAGATVNSIREMGGVWYALMQLGYVDVHVLVPQVRVKEMEQGLTRLMKLMRDDHEVAHFYRRLGHEENERLRAWYQSREKVMTG